MAGDNVDNEQPNGDFTDDQVRKYQELRAKYQKAAEGGKNARQPEPPQPVVPDEAPVVPVVEASSLPPPDPTPPPEDVAPPPVIAAPAQQVDTSPEDVAPPPVVDRAVPEPPAESPRVSRRALLGGAFLGLLGFVAAAQVPGRNAPTPERSRASARDRLEQMFEGMKRTPLELKNLNESPDGAYEVGTANIKTGNQNSYGREESLFFVTGRVHTESPNPKEQTVVVVMPDEAAGEAMIYKTVQVTSLGQAARQLRLPPPADPGAEIIIVPDYYVDPKAVEQHKLGGFTVFAGTAQRGSAAATGQQFLPSRLKDPSELAGLTPKTVFSIPQVKK